MSEQIDPMTSNPQGGRSGLTFQGVPAACAHLHVEHKRLGLDPGPYTDRWACRDCLTQFEPKTFRLPFQVTKPNAEPDTDRLAREFWERVLVAYVGPWPLPQKAVEHADSLLAEWHKRFDPGKGMRFGEAEVIAFDAGVKDERERCAKIVEDERVDAEATGEETDISYNSACLHIAERIRSGQ